jgi:hypothetical protein
MASTSGDSAPERDQITPPHDNNNTTTHDQSDKSEYDVVDAKLMRFLKKSGLKQTQAKLIDLNLINKDITDESTVLHRNTWVAARAKDYRRTKRCRDDMLLVEYQENYEEWTEKDFDKVNKDILRVLCDALVLKGVNINKGSSKKIAKSLIIALNYEHALAWTAVALKITEFATDTRTHYYQLMGERGEPIPSDSCALIGKERV